MEVAGHVYNYGTKFDGEQRRAARTIFPMQAFATIIVFALLLKLFAWY